MEQAALNFRVEGEDIEDFRISAFGISESFGSSWTSMRECSRTNIPEKASFMSMISNWSWMLVSGRSF